MPVGRMMEVILYVQHMGAMVSFYRDVLGLRILHPRQSTDYGRESWVTLDTGPCLLALHAGGQGRLGQDTAKIVFEVEDVQRARQELLGRGVDLKEVRSPVPGVRVVDGLDPEGHPFSLEEHEPAS